MYKYGSFEAFENNIIEIVDNRSSMKVKHHDDSNQLEIEKHLFDNDDV